MCQSTANVAVTAPQDTAQRLFETFINGAAIEPYLFPQLNNPLAEFLVDAISQTWDEQEPQFLFHSADTLRNLLSTGELLHPYRLHVCAAEGVMWGYYLQRTRLPARRCLSR